MAMTKRETNSRKILKFSHYSMALVLPKSTTAQFGWQPGDVINLRVQETEQAIILTKQRSLVLTPSEDSKVVTAPNETVVQLSVNQASPQLTHVSEKPQGFPNVVTQGVTEKMLKSYSQEKFYPSPAHDLLPIPELTE